MYFNGTVLARRRRDDPANAARYNLGFKDGLYTVKGQGPVYEIIRFVLYFIKVFIICDIIYNNLILSSGLGLSPTS